MLSSVRTTIPAGAALSSVMSYSSVSCIYGSALEESCLPVVVRSTAWQQGRQTMRGRCAAEASAAHVCLLRDQNLSAMSKSSASGKGGTFGLQCGVLYTTLHIGG